MPESVEQRFGKRLVYNPETGCVEWMGYRSTSGYGQFTVSDKQVPAHRWAYEYAVGPIPEGREIDHLCRNRACVDPDHLEAVTPRENWRRGVSVTAENDRKTSCVNGHPFDEQNTVPRNRGRHRECRTCRADMQRRWRARRAAKGLCTRCCVAKAAPGYKSCEPCLAAYAERNERVALRSALDKFRTVRTDEPKRRVP